MPGSTQPTKSKSEAEVAAEFKSYYLQRATKEFAEDLDKVRGADDFKNDAVALLVQALGQGTAMFSPEEQARIVNGRSQGGGKTDGAGKGSG